MIKDILKKPFMCRKTLSRGWVARKHNGRIVWVYDPEVASAIQANKHLIKSSNFKLTGRTHNVKYSKSPDEMFRREDHGI